MFYATGSQRSILTFEHTSLMEICSEWDFRLYVKSEKSEFEPWHIKELKIVFFSFPNYPLQKLLTKLYLILCSGTHFDIALTRYKSADGIVSDFVLGERTSKLHLPTTKVVDGTVSDSVLGERKLLTDPFDMSLTHTPLGAQVPGTMVLCRSLCFLSQHVLCHVFFPEDRSPLFPLLKF